MYLAYSQPVERYLLVWTVTSKTVLSPQYTLKLSMSSSCTCVYSVYAEDMVSLPNSAIKSIVRQQSLDEHVEALLTGSWSKGRGHL